MKRLPLALAALALSAALTAAWAARPLVLREKADFVLVGKVTKITSKKEPVRESEYTYYTARVEVTKVEKGKGVKSGETVSVTWYVRTKAPSKPDFGDN